jgi:hypothetical protein
MADALYAPQVPPQNEPNYMNWFHPARPHEGNQAGKFRGQATAEAFAGAGKLIGQGAEAADNIVKNYLDTKQHQMVDPLQEAMSKQLEGALKATETPGQEPQEPNDPYAGLYDQAGPGQRPQMPERLNQGLRTAGMIQEAAEYGKFTPTYYLGRINEINKQLRSEWPGYRREIDATSHQITGHPIANAYMMSLMHDLNQRGSGKDQMVKNLVSALDKAANEGSDPARVYAMKLRSGEWGYEYTQAKFTKMMAPFWAAKVEENKAKMVEAGDKNSINEARKGYMDFFGQKMQGLMDIPAIQADKGDGQTWMSIHQHQQAIERGDIKPDAQGIAAAGQQVNIFVQHQRDALMAWGKNIANKGNDGLTPYGRDPEGFTKDVETLLKPLKDYFDDLTDPNRRAVAFYTANMQKNLQQSNWGKALKGELGPEAQILTQGRDALIGMVGEKGYELWLGNNIPKLEKASQSEQMAQTLDLAGLALNKGGRPVWTLEDTAAFSKKQNRDPSTGKLQDMDFAKYRGVTENFEKFPKPLQESYATYLFTSDPTKLPFLDHLKRDYRDPETGEQIQGKFRAFVDMTRPGMTKAIAKLDSQYGEKQQHWAEQNFSHLLGSEIQNLTQFQRIPGVEWHYDKDSHQLVLNKDQAKIDAATRSIDEERGKSPGAFHKFGSAAEEVKIKIDQIEQARYNLNLLLRGYGNIATAHKTDVNDYISNLFRQKGYDSNNLPQGNYGTDLLTGIASSLYDVVHGDTRAKGSVEPADKKKKEDDLRL